MPQVWIGGTEIYLDADKLPEFTYSLTDISDPSKVRGARSTSFEIPATNAVRQALGGVTMSEGAALSASFRIGEAGATLFNGTCTPVEWSDDSITVNAFSDNAGWAQDAKGTKLQDVNLGISELVTETYQRDSWTDQERADCYPLICYGSFEDRSSAHNVTVAKLRPAVRVHRLLNKFFNDRGYTVRAVGRLARHWKGLILPNTGKVKIAQETLDASTASVQGTAGLTPVVYSLWPSTAPADYPAPVVITDPGGNMTGNVYTAPVDMRLRIRVNGTNIHSGGSFGTQQSQRITVYRPNLSNLQLGGFTYYAIGPTWTQTFNDQTVWEGDVAMGDQVAVGIYSAGSLYSCFTDATVTFEPASIDFTEGVKFDISGSAPKMSVGELIGGLCNVLRLVVSTDDSTHTVTFSYYNDFAKSPADGIDWRDRLDQTELIKVQPAIPSSWLFRFKEDSNDLYLRGYAEVNDRGYGDTDWDIPMGVDKPVEIEVPFAATISKMRFGNIIIPAMRKEGPYYQQDFYEYQPRLLVMDGTVDAFWRHDGTDMTYAPNTYFVGITANDISLSFGRESDPGGNKAGTVEKEWSEFIRRSYSPMLQVKVRVYDDEFLSFSFGRPRLVHDGWHYRWCYVQEVKGKRFGDESFVECELIPV
jgi:hypothetical protein